MENSNEQIKEVIDAEIISTELENEDNLEQNGEEETRGNIEIEPEQSVTKTPESVPERRMTGPKDAFATTKPQRELWFWAFIAFLGPILTVRVETFLIAAGISLLVPYFLHPWLIRDAGESLTELREYGMKVGLIAYAAIQNLYFLLQGFIIVRSSILEWLLITGLTCLIMLFLVEVKRNNAK